MRQGARRIGRRQQVRRRRRLAGGHRLYRRDVRVWFQKRIGRCGLFPRCRLPHGGGNRQHFVKGIKQMVYQPRCCAAEFMFR